MTDFDQNEWLAERHGRACGRTEGGPHSAAVAGTFSGRARAAQPALVNGAVGLVWAPRGRPRVVFAFTITRGKIVEIDLVADHERLSQLDLAVPRRLTNVRCGSGRFPDVAGYFSPTASIGSERQGRTVQPDTSNRMGLPPDLHRNDERTAALAPLLDTYTLNAAQRA